MRCAIDLGTTINVRFFNNLVCVKNIHINAYFDNFADGSLPSLDPEHRHSADNI